MKNDVKSEILIEFILRCRQKVVKWTKFIISYRFRKLYTISSLNKFRESFSVKCQKISLLGISPNFKSLLAEVIVVVCYLNHV